MILEVYLFITYIHTFVCACGLVRVVKAKSALLF